VLIFRNKEFNLNLTVLEDFEVDIQHHVSLSQFTTFQLGGPCRGLLHCRTPHQLEKIIRQFNETDTKFILIGGGSNLVVSDQGVECFVIRYFSETPLIECEGHEIIVSGGTLLDDLAKFAVECGLVGLNCTTGIPGTVGGAIVGNAGAFGKQIGDVIHHVSLISQIGQKTEVGSDQLQFSYRHSVLKESKDIVLSARLKLQPGDKKALQKEREEILALRKAKHPDLSQQPCAGSFYRNIEPTSKAGQRQAAGWFLDRAGGKSLQYGGAKIFEKHANIIIKTKECTSQDVFELALMMAQLAKKSHGLDLIREVRFVGNFLGKPADVNDFIW